MQLALPERRWVSRFLFVAAILIAIATVYGRYHYLADGLAGLVMAILARAAAKWADSEFFDKRAQGRLSVACRKLEERP